MPLTPEQQAQLAELQAAQDAPPVRTREGLAGVLHALVESVSGLVPHRSPEEWLQLAETVEHVAGAAPAEAESGDQPAGGDQASGGAAGG
jgi:hypothetical protein